MILLHTLYTHCFCRGELKTGFTFIIDKRGDPELSFYGGTHSYSVPAFRRSGRKVAFNDGEK